MKYPHTLALWLSLLLLCTPTHAQEAQDKATALFEAAVASPSVPGISVAIAGRDGVIWASGFGWADIENQVPMSTTTKMRIGSVAKVFTTAGLMRLYDQGKIDLDRDVRDYVPSWPGHHDTINLRQLASHTSGIRHYKGMEFLSNTPYPTVTSSLDIFKDDPLKFSPGTEYSYSTYAWTLVSAIMEKADGARNFIEIIEDEVFAPLGMADTSFDFKNALIPNRQRPYSYVEGEIINSPQTDHSYKWAGGGFIASTSDVSRLAVAHSKPGYLKAKTLTTMFTPYKLKNGQEVSNGIGWGIGFKRRIEAMKNSDVDYSKFIKIMEEHPNSVMHSGGSAGGITMMILCLDHDRAVTVVKNVDSEDSANVLFLALNTLDIFYHK